MNIKIESLLAARLFLFPQLVGDQIFFISNISGKLSLYKMNYGGSVPEPLLPPNISLQNPDLIGGLAFRVFPEIDQVLVMIDQDGDEIYQPYIIPLDGGFPEVAFNNAFSGYRTHLTMVDDDRAIVYFAAEKLDEPISEAYFGNLATTEVRKIAASKWGSYPIAHNEDHSQVIIVDSYTVGDNFLTLLENDEQTALFGKALEERSKKESIPLKGIESACFTPNEKALLVTTTIFDDHFSVGQISLSEPGEMTEVTITGTTHTGNGELEGLERLINDHYLLKYNIDGVSICYEAKYVAASKTLKVKHVIVGDYPLDNGVLEHIDYNKEMNIFTLTFSNAISPTQIYSIEKKNRDFVVLHTSEKVLGLPEHYLTKGEDASFTSFDGTRVSARLYLPSPSLHFEGPRPLVYYIHGGPQSQERPNFAWFSMPLIQFLTLNGFAVFVPNVRGSTGYGLNYTKQVDQDWGGEDRKDHVFAMEQVLSKDARIDTKRAGVMGRSYGGYMTLIQAGMHSDLWKGAVDMFGPYDLLTFSDRIPETWKPYFKVALGDPSTKDGVKFLTERSPKKYLQNLACPMLVIQGRNDPRVVASESEDLVKNLSALGKDIAIHVFEDEGHDVLKYNNRVDCYSMITEFFRKNLV